MTMPATDHPLRLAARCRPRRPRPAPSRTSSIPRPLRQRLIRTGLILAAARRASSPMASFVLDFDPGPASRQASGKLGQFMWFMLPPSTGTWAQVLDLPATPWRRPSPSPSSARSLARRFSPCQSASSRRRTSMPNVVVYFLSRRIVDTIRGVDELIWALIWVSVVGLGPVCRRPRPALLPISALFSKLFSEAIEAADRKSVRGNRLHRRQQSLHGIRFGILPAGSADLRQPGPLLSSRATPARRLSSASSAPVASVCIWPNRSASLNTSTSRH